MFDTSLTALEELFRQQAPEMQMERDALMARYTTLHLGGPADLMVHPANRDQLQMVLRAAKKSGVPVTVIGHGSNLLVLDGGIRGLVIRICRGMDSVEVEGETLRCDAGVMMSVVAMAAANNSLGGLTFASGIPGTIGGGVYMNAGAYGGELSQVVTLVEGLDMAGEPFSYTGEEMGFTHRYSRLMEEDKIITRVTMKLHPAKQEDLLAEMVLLNRQRADKQPLTMFSAGSTFKRPVGGYASALVDQCGLKGYTIGGAQVSEKHAGFLLNRGGTAADFMALMAYVQKVVYQKTGFSLEPEVRILGEEVAPQEV